MAGRFGSGKLAGLKEALRSALAPECDGCHAQAGTMDMPIWQGGRVLRTFHLCQACFLKPPAKLGVHWMNRQERRQQRQARGELRPRYQWGVSTRYAQGVNA